MGELYRDRWYAGSLGALAVLVALGAVLLLAGGSPSSAETTLAAVTPVASATATPAADPATVDFARALDLLAVRDALAAYRNERGSYPDTGGVIETLCAEGGDAGCALSALNDDLATNDGTQPYWYVSDGASYTLVARAELEQPEGQVCPAVLPEALEDGPVMCMTGRGE